MELNRQVSYNELHDLDGLQNVLDSLSGKLALPYLSRRSGSMHSDPIEELGAALEELSARERELQAAIGISKFLLERGKELKQRKEYYSLRCVQLEEQQASTTLELQGLRRDWQLERDRKEEFARELATLDSQATALASANRDLQEQIDFKGPLRHNTSLDMTESLLCDLREQHSELRRKSHPGAHEALQRRSNDLESANSLLENDQTQLRIDLRKAKFDLDKQRERAESQTQACTALKSALQDQIQQCSSLQFKLAKAQAEVQRLSSDSAYLSEAVVPTFSRKRTHSRHLSLVSEIKRLEDDESDIYPRVVKPFGEIEEQDEEIMGESLPSIRDEELFRGNCPAPSLPLSTLHFTVALSLSVLPVPAAVRTIVTMLQVDIPPVPTCCTACKKKRYSAIPTRREPLEEYFLLVSPMQATQAVKLNSPHIDSICTAAPETLYQQAVTAAVPFQHVYDI